MFGQFSRLIYIVCLLAFAQMALAQQGNNPFELPERTAIIDAMKTTADSTALDSILAVSNNPFEIISDYNSEKETSTPTDSTIQPAQDSEPIPNIWMGGIVLILGVLIAILNTAHSSELQRTFRSFTNQNLLNFNFRSQKGRLSSTHLLSYTLYAVSLGAFLYLLGWYWRIPALTGSIYSALICMGFVALIMFARHLFLRIIGWIMPFDKELSVYNYMISVFNHVLGITLLPFIIVAAFAPDPLKKIALFGGLGVILFVYLYRSIRGFMLSGRFLALHKFHFFLYLCAVEIAPVLILIKILSLSA